MKWHKFVFGLQRYFSVTCRSFRRFVIPIVHISEKWNRIRNSENEVQQCIVYWNYETSEYRGFLIFIITHIFRIMNHFHLWNYEHSDIKRTSGTSQQMFEIMNPLSTMGLWTPDMGQFVFRKYETLQLWTFGKTKPPLPTFFCAASFRRFCM